MSVEGETLVQSEVSRAPGTYTFDIDTSGVSRLLIQGVGDANTTVKLSLSFDGGATFPVDEAAAALLTAVGVIKNVATSKVRVSLIQATTTVVVKLAVAGIA